MAEPVQTKFVFNLPLVSGTHFLDISQIVSIVNRKFLRQGLNWVVSNMELWSNGNSKMIIYKLPDSWMMANAWTKSFHAWQTQQESVLDGQPSLAGKYRDFKIFYDSDHEQAGFGLNLLPHGYSGAFGLDDAYDWDHTNIEIPTDGGALAPVRFNLHALGATTATSKALIHGYALSRSRPQQEDPNVPLYGGWLQHISDVAEIDPYIRQDLSENNTPPYPVAAADGVNQNQEFYPGGNQQAPDYNSFIQDALVTRTTTSLNADSSGAFLAPCGLLRLGLEHTATSEPTICHLFLEVSPGPERGFLAQPMQEMN